MIRSLWTWAVTGTLILSWIPLLAVRRLFDRDAALYRTGLLFRKLGRAITKANPSWRLHISGRMPEDPRRPYVVVCNHQSLADIPLISNLPWEMKWLAKEELFRLPVLGWLLRLSGDIPVDRGNARSGARALVRAKDYLQKKCSVFIFPEGTRTSDGNVGEFSDGAFHLAIAAQAPLLPVAIDGTFAAIRKSSWRFGRPSDIFLKVFEPIDTAGLTLNDLSELRERARKAIVQQIHVWRSGEQREGVDRTFPGPS